MPRKAIDVYARQYGTASRLYELVKKERSIPSPFEAPELWETLIITNGGNMRVSVLGVVTVDVTGLALREDEKPIPNPTTGGKNTYRTFLGYEDAKASIKINVIDETEYYKLRSILELFRNRRTNAQPKRYVFIHPNLQLHGIKFMYIFAITAPDYDPDTGYTVTLECKEWQERTINRSYYTSAASGADGGNAHKTNPPPKTPTKPTSKPTSKPKPQGNGLLQRGNTGLRDGSNLAPKVINPLGLLPKESAAIMSSAEAARLDRPSIRLEKNPVVMETAKNFLLGKRTLRGE
jgi:hypothetical protein